MYWFLGVNGHQQDRRAGRRQDAVPVLDTTGPRSGPPQHTGMAAPCARRLRLLVVHRPPWLPLAARLGNGCRGDKSAARELRSFARRVASVVGRRMPTRRFESARGLRVSSRSADVAVVWTGGDRRRRPPPASTIVHRGRCPGSARREGGSHVRVRCRICPLWSAPRTGRGADLGFAVTARERAAGLLPRFRTACR